MVNKILLLIAALAFSAPFASAESVCLKSTIKKSKKGVLSISNVTTNVADGASCPRGSKLLLNLGSIQSAGTQGPQGPKGDQGAQGSPGLDGKLAVYGDGNRGDLVVNTGQIVQLDSPNLQFNNINVKSGSSLFIPSGATVRCLGDFTNNGFVYVKEQSQSPLPIAVNRGAIPGSPNYFGNFAYSSSSQTDEVGGSFSITGSSAFGAGSKGVDLPQNFQARLAIRPVALGGGAGGNAYLSGATGGGFAAILARGQIINSGTIGAPGTNGGTGPSAGGGGGGGGGILVLASMAGITNSGVLTVSGGNGASAGTFASSQSICWGAGGGGGGGILQLLAPVIQNTGTLNTAKGSAGANSSPVSVAGSSPTFMASYGGGGGGGNFGAGGQGGTCSSNVGTKIFSFQSAGDGFAGTLVQNLIDPTPLF